jgi:hypothetical protein
VEYELPVREYGIEIGQGHRPRRGDQWEEVGHGPLARLPRAVTMEPPAMKRQAPSLNTDATAASGHLVTRR